MYLEKKVYLVLDEEQDLKINVIFKQLTLVYNEGINYIKDYYKEYKTFVSRDYLVSHYKNYSKQKFLPTIEPLLINFTLYMALDACIEAANKKLKVQYKSLTYKKHQIKIAPSLIKDRKKDSITINVFKGETTTNVFKLKKFGSIPKSRKMYDIKFMKDATSFFLIFALETEERELLVPKSIGVGIDVGIKNLATLSDGRIYPNVAHSARMKKLFKMRREVTVELGRLLKMSKDRDKELPSCKVIKLKERLNNLDEKITNYRRDYLHKVSAEIIYKNPRFIVIETLNILDMSVKNKSIAENFLKASVGMFLTMITYKAQLYKIPLIKVPEDYPSSKMCCSCGKIKTDLALQDRVYECDYCGIKVDRDINAAVNLYKYGLWLYRNERLRLDLQITQYYTKMYNTWRDKISKYIYTE